MAAHRGGGNFSIALTSLIAGAVNPTDPTIDTPVPPHQPNPDWSDSKSVTIGCTVHNATEAHSIWYRFDADGDGKYNIMTGIECFQLYGSCIGTCQAATTVFYDEDGSNLIFEWAVATGNPVIDEHNLVVCSGSESACGAEDDWMVRIDSTTPGTPSFCWDGYPDIDQSDHPDQTIYWGGVCNCVSGVTYTLKRQINHSGRWVLVDENIDGTQYHDGNFLCSPGDFIEYSVFGTNAAGTEGEWQFSDGFIFTGQRLDGPGYLWEGNGDSDGSTEDVDFDPDGKVLLNWAYNQDADTPIVFRLEKSVEFGPWTLVAQNLTNLTYTDEDTTDSYKDEDYICYRIRAEIPSNKKQVSNWIFSDGFFLSDDPLSYDMVIFFSPQYAPYVQQIGTLLRQAVDEYISAVDLSLGWKIKKILLSGGPEGTNTKEYIDEKIEDLWENNGVYAALIVGEDIDQYLYFHPEMIKYGGEYLYKCYPFPNTREWENTIEEYPPQYMLPEVFVSLLLPCGTLPINEKLILLKNTFLKFANQRIDYGDQMRLLVAIEFGTKSSHYTCFESVIPETSQGGIFADSYWFGNLEKTLNPTTEIVNEALDPQNEWKVFLTAGHGGWPPDNDVWLNQRDEWNCPENDPECTEGCDDDEPDCCIEDFEQAKLHDNDLDQLKTGLFVSSGCNIGAWQAYDGYLTYPCDENNHPDPIYSINTEWMGHSILENNYLRMCMFHPYWEGPGYYLYLMKEAIAEGKTIAEAYVNIDNEFFKNSYLIFYGDPTLRFIAYDKPTNYSDIYIDHYDRKCWLKWGVDGNFDCYGLLDQDRVFPPGKNIHVEVKIMNKGDLSTSCRIKADLYHIITEELNFFNFS